MFSKYEIDKLNRGDNCVVVTYPALRCPARNTHTSMAWMVFFEIMAKTPVE
jgi:hypothetical protein